MPLADISLGNFSTISYDDPDNAGTFVPIANVQSLTHPSDNRNIVEVPQYGQIYPRKLVGSSSTGDCTVLVNFDPSEASHAKMLEFYTDGTQQLFQIDINEDNAGTSSSYFQFRGRVASKTSSGEFDAVTTVEFAIAIDGAIGDWDVVLP